MYLQTAKSGSKSQYYDASIAGRGRIVKSGDWGTGERGEKIGEWATIVIAGSYKESKFL